MDLTEISEICAEKSKTWLHARLSAFSLVYYMQVISRNTADYLS
jgi:hypothetical protein